MKIGVYGGTFDPPHMGHLEAARAAMDLLGLDRMLFIPAAVPPHKVLPPEAAAAGDRLAMAEQMADGLTLLTGRPGCAQAGAAPAGKKLYGGYPGPASGKISRR